ncbi:uncharacterized protein proca1 [Stigmatopora argus]
MWWLVLVVVSYLDREAVRAAVAAPTVEERRSERGVLPFVGAGEAKRRGSEEMLRRVKRGFTYPGTLWCGAGNMADNYDQLGRFEKTDSCCRTHDHCPHVIHAFSTKYGYTNFKLHSICHCDCDEALKNCLRRVNNTSSRMVGQVFFNVIGAPCFDLLYEEQCTDRHWYGVCKQYEKVPIAVVKEAVPYDYGGEEIVEEVTRASSEGKGRGEEDLNKVLATVSSPSSADTDKESQTSEKKVKDGVDKKKKRRRKGKVGHQKTQGQSEARSKPSHVVMKDGPLMETAKYLLTGPPAGSPLKNRQPKKSKKTLTAGETTTPIKSLSKIQKTGKEKVLITSVEEIPQLAVEPYKLSVSSSPTILMAKNQSGKEIPHREVELIHSPGATNPFTVEKNSPGFGSISKIQKPKNMRKERLLVTSVEEIPQPKINLTKNLSVTSIPNNLHKEMFQPVLDLNNNLCVPSPRTREKASSPKTKRRRKAKATETQPLFETAKNLGPIIKSQRKCQRPGKAIALAHRVRQPAVTGANPSILDPQSEQQLPGVGASETPTPAVHFTKIQSVLQVTPASQQQPEQFPKFLRPTTATSTATKSFSQIPVQTTSNPSATFISTSQPERDPGEKVYPQRDNKSRKKKRKARLNLTTQNTTSGTITELSQTPLTIAASLSKVSIVKRHKSSEGRQKNVKTTTTTPSAMKRNNAKKSEKKYTPPRELSIPEFPGLTSTPVATTDRNEHSTPRVSATPNSSAMQWSMKRVREQFAWKKRRKAALSVKSLTLAV